MCIQEVLSQNTEAIKAFGEMVIMKDPANITTKLDSCGRVCMLLPWIFQKSHRIIILIHQFTDEQNCTEL